MGKLVGPLRRFGVQLGDFSLHSGSGSLGDQNCTIAVRALNAVVRIGLDSVSFIGNNPTWQSTETFAAEVDSLVAEIEAALAPSPVSMQVELSCHVLAGSQTVPSSTTSRLVNQELLGPAQFYAVGVYRYDGSLVLDKSAVHENAIFLKVSRIFDVVMSFTQAIPKVLEDELAALRLLDLSEVG